MPIEKMKTIDAANLKKKELGESMQALTDKCLGGKGGAKVWDAGE